MCFVNYYARQLLFICGSYNHFPSNIEWLWEKSHISLCPSLSLSYKHAHTTSPTSVCLWIARTTCIRNWHCDSEHIHSHTLSKQNSWMNRLANHRNNHHNKWHNNSNIEQLKLDSQCNTMNGTSATHHITTLCIHQDAHYYAYFICNNYVSCQLQIAIVELCVVKCELVDSISGE